MECKQTKLEMAHIKRETEDLCLHWLLPIEVDDVTYSNFLLYCGHQATIKIQLGRSNKLLSMTLSFLQHCYMQY